MGEFSVFHWLVVLAIILIFFGGRRIPEVMKGLGEGIRSFKDGIAGGTATATAPAPAQPTALAAPGGVTAKAGHGQVSINWIPSTGASNYNVKRSGNQRRTLRTDRFHCRRQLLRRRIGERHVLLRRRGCRSLRRERTFGRSQRHDGVSHNSSQGNFSQVIEQLHASLGVFGPLHIS